MGNREKVSDEGVFKVRATLTLSPLCAQRIAYAFP